MAGYVVVIIDAHHHLWRFTPEDYPWIGPADQVLRRHYLEAELSAVADGSGLAGTVVVQARQTLEETRWLLDVAQRQPLIRGVVGWVPLADVRLPEILDRCADRRLVGVRHVVQGEPDPGFLMQAGIQRGLAEVDRHGLAYDLLIKADQLPQAIACVRSLPTSLRFILDHGGKPDIRAGKLQTWASDLAQLARFPNVACKLSGLVTEADPSSWSENGLAPYVRTMLDCFGPYRVLFGSDWPVCLLGTSHRRWLDAVRTWIADYPASEQAAILGGNALTWYRLEHP